MKAEWRLPADPRSVPAARRFVREALAGFPPDTVHQAALMVSELATNCVVHAGTEFIVTLTVAGRVVRIEVTDQGGGHPRVESPTPIEPHGRGLRLVHQLSTVWGIDSSRRSTGKTLWFALLLHEAPSRRRTA